MLTQWEKQLKMLEDWLSNRDIEKNFQRDAIEEEFHPKEKLLKLSLYQKMKRS
jgi:hypothetical protein